MKKWIFMLVVSMFSINMNARTLSRAGREFIKNVEQCSLRRHWDNGAWSIGYGHRMPKGTKQYTVINKKQAEALLIEDLRVIEKTANDILKELKWKPSQSFYDGLVSIIYNCGTSGIYKTDFYKRLKRCRNKNGKVNINDLKYTIAAVKTARIPSGKYADGVRTRRNKEYALMLG